MKSLREQIRDREIGNLYLFFGDEPYLIRLNTERLKRALLTEEDEMMNLEVMETPVDADAVLSSIETLPFMAERRLVILKETGAFGGKPGKKLPELEEILADIPETTTVLIVESDVDKRSKLYKKLQTAGQTQEMNHPEEEVLMKWVVGELKQAGHRISRNDLSYFLSLTGTEMERILQEVNKLTSYAGEQEDITREMIDAVVSPTVEASIFRMTDALSEKRSGQAYRIYRDLLTQGEPVQRIQFMMIRQVRLLYRASLLQGVSPEAAAKELGVPSFAARNLLRQSSRFGREKLHRLMEKLLEADVQVKSGEMSPEEAADLTILSYFY